MTTSNIPSHLTRLVARRAGYRCEYCHTPQRITGQTFHCDHIVPRSRNGQTFAENLAFACPHCNLAKQDKQTAADPRTKRNVRLYNPRLDVWEEHFRWSVDFRRIFGRTPIGRATVAALRFNAPELMSARPLWYLLNLIP